jgi:hypothetical protein
MDLEGYSGTSKSKATEEQPGSGIKLFKSIFEETRYNQKINNLNSMVKVSLILNLIIIDCF